ncbi:major facilitator superfamily domain-containing protein [Ilyonectria robusta]|uniref:major facilitator superfamily domain-containing protein n=1 Tax=Ilyonectria robusta TaxID=1079257 RepID=UPI001E8CA7B9|nr:major facilitator superfamily domain-containing protein [Ilyonectria robusta]KAH8736285.1 major facilitator superfamily domain-containing protein [Ilyonectria robusta]
MAAIMSPPDYSTAALDRSRLSVRLPKDTLHSSLMASSQHFHFDRETAALARNANAWLSSEEDLARPVSIAESNFSTRSIEHEDYHQPPRNPRDYPVFGSLRYSLRYDDARPRTAPRTATKTESTEKLTQGINDDSATSSRHSDDDIVYPTGMKLALITLALCLAVFVMALDNSIIATAIPKITDEFHSLNDVGWYGSAYMLTGASLQLLFGKIYTFWTIKWTFLATVAIFEVGSLICGVAGDSVTLIIGRAVAGVGSAGIFAGALTILAYTVPLHKRPVYTGLVSGMWGISSVAGPLLGGFLTDRASWRWCFYINLPIGVITMVVIAVYFSDPERHIEPAPWRVRAWQLDPIGTAIFMPAIICLLLALQWGGVDYAWSNSKITSLFMLAAVLILLFLYVQYRMGENATVPPRIFKKRSVWASCFFSFNTGACFLTAVYFLPIWFQAVKGSSAIQSGVNNLPMLLGVVIFSMVAGAIVTYWGYYTPFMIGGSIFMAIGYGLICTLKVDTPTAGWIGYQLLAGVGVGIGMQQPLVAVQVVCDMADVPTGTAMIIFVQTLGGALCVTAGQTIFTNTLIEKIHEYVPDLDPAVVIAAGATNIRDAIRAEWLPDVIRAYNDALNVAFLVGAATASATIIGAAFTEWKSVKGKNIEMAVA